MMYEMSGIRKAELKEKVPDFDNLKEIKIYSDDDRKKILAQMR